VRTGGVKCMSWCLFDQLFHGQAMRDLTVRLEAQAKNRRREKIFQQNLLNEIFH
jgi:hypothetical protein